MTPPAPPSSAFTLSTPRTARCATALLAIAPFLRARARALQLVFLRTVPALLPRAQVRVHEVNADSPLAGRVLPGDVVLALDGDDCSSMNMEALVALVTSRKDAPERVFKLRREEANANASAPGAEGGTIDDVNAGAPGADGGTVDAEVGAPPSAELDDATKQEGEGRYE